MNVFAKSYDDQTNWMMTNWDNVNADIKKEFDSEPVYNKKFLETKIRC